MHSTTIRSWPAMLGGILAASGAIAMLVRDAQTGWTMEMALMPVLVVLTILAAHLAAQAFRTWRLLSAVAMILLATFGAALTLVETMGRRATVIDTATAVVARSAYQTEQLLDDQAEARRQVRAATAAVSASCNDGKGKFCLGAIAALETHKYTLAGIAIAIGKAPTIVADAKAARVVAIAELAGVPQEHAQKAYELLLPFALPAALELASVIMFGAAFGHRRIETLDVTPTPAQAQAQAPPATTSSSGSTTALPAPAAPTTLDIQLAAVLAALQQGECSNGELAARMNVEKSEASKRVKTAVLAGLISKTHIGRNVKLALL